jgi:hypothetical protein
VFGEAVVQHHRFRYDVGTPVDTVARDVLPWLEQAEEWWKAGQPRVAPDAGWRDRELARVNAGR